MSTARQLHWPRGPYAVHPGSTTDCGKFWCTISGEHEHYVDCTCGWSARAKKIRDVTAMAMEHLDGVRRELKAEAQGTPAGCTVTDTT